MDITKKNAPVIKYEISLCSAQKFIVFGKMYNSIYLGVKTGYQTSITMEIFVLGDK